MLCYEDELPAAAEAARPALARPMRSCLTHEPIDARNHVVAVGDGMAEGAGEPGSISHAPGTRPPETSVSTTEKVAIASRRAGERAGRRPGCGAGVLLLGLKGRSRAPRRGLPKGTEEERDGNQLEAEQCPVPKQAGWGRQRTQQGCRCCAKRRSFQTITSSRWSLERECGELGPCGAERLRPREGGV